MTKQTYMAVVWAPDLSMKGCFTGNLTQAVIWARQQQAKHRDCSATVTDVNKEQ